MPRYSTRTLLIVFGLIGLWLATFAGGGAAQDIRRSMLLLGLVGATCLAIFGQGKRRVFWTGFAVVMFLCGGLSMDRPLHRYVPGFTWQRTLTINDLQGQRLSRNSVPVSLAGAPTVWIGVTDTMTAGWTLALSALAGYVAAYIYSRSQNLSSPPLSAATLSAREIVEQELRDLR